MAQKTKTFARGLNNAQWAGLQTLQDADDLNWWKHLLSLWVPSGQPSGSYGLRLAVRDGSLNFYRRGQSIAQVSFGPGKSGYAKPRMKIHARYVMGQDADAVYRSFGENDASYPDLAKMHEWIANSAYKHGPEKWGVDDVIGRNASIVDLEMGMPGSALRVDIVALEKGPTRPRLVLWEAKPLNASALRAKAEKAKIHAQMEGYNDFCDCNPGVLESAYKTHCAALVKFAGWAGKAEKLSPLVAAAATDLDLDGQVGLALFRGVRLSASGDRELIPYAGNWDAHRLKLVGVKLREAQDPADLVLASS